MDREIEVDQGNGQDSCDYKQNLTGQVISPVKNASGYLYAGLCKQGAREDKYIHRLVARAFIPNPDDKPEVNHILGIKGFNWSIHLEWCTRTENLRHQKNHNLYNTDFSEDQVREIKRLLAQGDLNQKQIAEKYDVSRTCISHIDAGHTWSHIQL